MIIQSEAIGVITEIDIDQFYSNNGHQVSAAFLSIALLLIINGKGFILKVVANGPINANVVPL